MTHIHSRPDRRKEEPQIRGLLFDLPAPYPHHPGFRDSATSKAAAIAVAPKAKTVRLAVLRIYADAYPHGLVADDAAHRLGKTPLWIRPRVTELKQLGLIEALPETRPNKDSGHRARVLRATAKGLQEAA